MPPTFQFAAPNLMWVAVSLAVIGLLIAAIRRVNLPRATLALLLIGATLLALAAGRPVWNRGAQPRIAVMVDVSPSTRGASWYDKQWLENRVRELIGKKDFQLYQFSSSRFTRVSSIDESEIEQSADETTFNPPADAEAVLLFSDCRFALPPNAPPSYVVIDPLLENPSDGAITRLTTNTGNDITLLIRNQLSRDPAEKPRYLAAEGLLPSTDFPVGETLAGGTFTFHAARDPAASAVSARVVGTDRWPENDALELASAAPIARVQRWWVTAGDSGQAPDSTWRTIGADAMPNHAAAYLAPSIIVLDDVPADGLPVHIQQRLAQYVRELGGTLLLIGGEHAFGAGGYGGTILDDLSPLLSTPPEPRRNWLLLLDSSGSMAATAAGSTRSRWQMAVDALLQAIPSLPANDPITVGSFADSVRWWSVSKPLRETLDVQLPPPDVVPRGPTNLQPVLEQLASSAASPLPMEVLILSDADASIDQPPVLAQRLRKAGVRVHLLATGAMLDARNPVAQLAAATDGAVAAEAAPDRWSRRLRELLRSASPEAIVRKPVSIQFAPSVGLASRNVSSSNTTWRRANAQVLASADGDAGTVLAAQHNVGLGSVIALAFAADAAEVAAMEKLFARPPRDPRFAITWDCGSTLRIAIDAIERDGSYINGLKPRLALSNDLPSEQTSEIAIPQTGPGRYELSLPAPRITRIATIRLDSAVLDRALIAGRYPPEFDAVGNDRVAMNRLADRTGGRVIEPSEKAPIIFRRIRQATPIGSELAFAGAALIALGLVHWRRLA